MTVQGQVSPDAVVIGSGPNGLAAAITLAEAGRSVEVMEANATIGGGCRSADLTLPGFLHDTCSAIHPMAMASPFFRELPLARFGLEWIQPPVALAHPFDDGTAALLYRSIPDTAATLDADVDHYVKIMAPFVEQYSQLVDPLLGPLRLPRHPVLMARFGLLALQSAEFLATHQFKGAKARGFFAGIAAHSILPLSALASAAIGLVLGLTGHAVGWPIPRGGSQQITTALASYLDSLGGTITTERRVSTLAETGEARAVLFDTSPRSLDAIAGDELPGYYRKQLGRFRHGPGVFKVDWALDGPVPWTAPGTADAGTVHLGGTLEEIAASEYDISRGRHPERPYVLIAQQSSFDSTRAPEGKHTLWGYCHVPSGSTRDMTAEIEAQIERFAPGFRDRILARSTMGPAAMEAANANYIGGDIGGGLQDIRQIFTRPVPQLDPYATPNRRLYICSSSTPPGGGVHGMSGYHAAHSALKRAPW